MKMSRNTQRLQEETLGASRALSAQQELNQYCSTVGLQQKCHVSHESLDLQELLITKLKITIQVVSFCLPVSLPVSPPPLAVLLLFFAILSHTAASCIAISITQHLTDSWWLLRQYLHYGLPYSLQNSLELFQRKSPT